MTANGLSDSSNDSLMYFKEWLEASPRAIAVRVACVYHHTPRRQMTDTASLIASLWSVYTSVDLIQHQREDQSSVSMDIVRKIRGILVLSAINCDAEISSTL